MAVNVIDSNRRVGFELEMYSTVDTFEELTYRNFFWGDTVEDGSIEPEYNDEFGCQGIEVRSKPIVVKEVASRVKEIQDNFIKKYKCKSNSSCGFHVHMDMTNSSEKQRLNIKKWWVAYEDAFRSLVPRWRQQSYWCQSVKMQGHYDNWDRDSTLNVWAFEDHGTFEIRLHQGTVDEDEIINWINLLALFFDTFQNRTPAITTGSLRAMFKDIKAPKSMRSYFYAKAKRYNEKSSSVRARSKVNS